jgi:hypothetical protein
MSTRTAPVALVDHVCPTCQRRLPADPRAVITCTHSGTSKDAFPRAIARPTPATKEPQT